MHLVKSIQGKREYMEDRWNVVTKNIGLLSNTEIIIAMVCDGHGGDSIADKTSKELPTLLIAALEKEFEKGDGNQSFLQTMTASPSSASNLDYAIAVRNTILTWGSDNIESRSGTTLTGVAIIGDTLIIYNVGDSRTCLHLKPISSVYFLYPTFNSTDGNLENTPSVSTSQASFFITPDHDPESTVEKERINKAGGALLGGRLNSILSVTRAIGDYGVGLGLSYVPDIFWCNRSDLNGPILMYSDGIYDTMKNQETNETKHVLYHGTEKHGPGALVDYATKLGSSDNITALMIKV